MHFGLLLPLLIFVYFALFEKIKYIEAVQGCSIFYQSDFKSKKALCDSDRSKLTQLPSDLPDNLIELRILDQSITYLDQKGLNHLVKLETMEIESSHLRQIELHTFKHLSSLKHLNLRNNSLRIHSMSLPMEVFKDLPNLRSLNLAENPIDLIPDGFFYQLKSIKLENLWMNSLKVRRLQIAPNALSPLDYLVLLDLSFSNLDTLHPNVEQALLGMPNLKKLYLAGNPWFCDCRLRWLPAWFVLHATHNQIEYRQNRSFSNPLSIFSPSLDRDYLRDAIEPKCIGPDRFKGRSLFSIDNYLNDLMELNSLNCPPIIANSTQNITFDLEKPLELKCEFYYTDLTNQILWFRDFTQIYNLSTDRIRIYNDDNYLNSMHKLKYYRVSILIIHRGMIEDSGSWTCFLGPNQVRFYLTTLDENGNIIEYTTPVPSGSSQMLFPLLFGSQHWIYTGVSLSLLIIILFFIGMCIVYCYGFQGSMSENNNNNNNNSQMFLTNQSSKLKCSNCWLGWRKNFKPNPAISPECHSLIDSRNYDNKPKSSFDDSNELGLEHIENLNSTIGNHKGNNLSRINKIHNTTITTSSSTSSNVNSFNNLSSSDAIPNKSGLSDPIMNSLNRHPNTALGLWCCSSPHRPIDHYGQHLNSNLVSNTNTITKFIMLDKTKSMINDGESLSSGLNHLLVSCDSPEPKLMLATDLASVSANLITSFRPQPWSSISTSLNVTNCRITGTTTTTTTNSNSSNVTMVDINKINSTTLNNDDDHNNQNQKPCPVHGLMRLNKVEFVNQSTEQQDQSIQFKTESNGLKSKESNLYLTNKNLVELVSFDRKPMESKSKSSVLWAPNHEFVEIGCPLHGNKKSKLKNTNLYKIESNQNNCNYTYLGNKNNKDLNNNNDVNDEELEDEELEEAVIDIVQTPMGKRSLNDYLSYNMYASTDTESKLDSNEDEDEEEKEHSNTNSSLEIDNLHKNANQLGTNNIFNMLKMNKFNSFGSSLSNYLNLQTQSLQNSSNSSTASLSSPTHPRRPNSGSFKHSFDKHPQSNYLKVATLPTRLTQKNKPRHLNCKFSSQHTFFVHPNHSNNIRLYDDKQNLFTHSLTNMTGNVMKPGSKHKLDTETDTENSSC